MPIIDSNIIIYAAQTVNADLRILLTNKDTLVSIISKVEVLGYHDLEEKDATFFNSVFEIVRCYSVSEEVINTAVKLRQQRKMTLGDSIIAATCLLNDKILYTANVADFKNIKGLKIINPVKHLKQRS